MRRRQRVTVSSASFSHSRARAVASPPLYPIRAETFGDRAGGQEFLCSVHELAVPGVMPSGLHALKFAFKGADLVHESYEGINARCRYYVHVTISRASYATGNITKDAHFAVRNVVAAPAADSSVKLEVGIEDCLHIEFEYDRTRYHLADVVTGRVNFLLVRIKIKYMEVAVIRREASGPCALPHPRGLAASLVCGSAPAAPQRLTSYILLCTTPHPRSRRNRARERDADAL